ncbi:programmed cell death 1 ligand 1-like [Oreochromis niloticus]|uniref:programmed cell death 1 ligand 1-like n=1 Tax=Oreochromis niloticus TaxID=8128 RepID=UPI00090471F7|nr:programmed cell death 1 ligand 1-like [Oreochromis niloticus]CAI5660314.1 unnamed protein product [Mustela putorius furo]
MDISHTYKVEMISVTSASLCWTLLFAYLLCVFADQKNIKAVVGQTVTLPCQAPKNNNSIIAAEWSRNDLGDKYLLLYWKEQFDPKKQHPSFKNRVDLQDRQMKDGDVSLILKDVTTTDSGTYECRVVQRGTNMDDDETISTIYLRVVAPGQTRRRREAVSDGVIIGQGVYIAAVFVVGLFIFYICYRRMNGRIN